MRPGISHAPAASHSTRTTVVAVALVVAATFVAVAAMSAPHTAATVAATTVAVLGVQRLGVAYHDGRWTSGAVDPADTAA